jgi:hypothetical protein
MRPTLDTALSIVFLEFPQQFFLPFRRQLFERGLEPTRLK